MNKKQIIQKLKTLELTFDKKSKKKDLLELLTFEVNRLSLEKAHKVIEAHIDHDEMDIDEEVEIATTIIDSLTPPQKIEPSKNNTMSQVEYNKIMNSYNKEIHSTAPDMVCKTTQHGVKRAYILNRLLIIKDKVKRRKYEIQLEKMDN